MVQLRGAQDKALAEAAEALAARRRADDGKARAEAERARLQRARDQLALALRVCVSLFQPMCQEHGHPLFLLVCMLSSRIKLKASVKQASLVFDVQQVLRAFAC